MTRKETLHSLDSISFLFFSPTISRHARRHGTSGRHCLLAHMQTLVNWIQSGDCEYDYVEVMACRLGALLYCCFTAALLLNQQYTAASLLLYCCFTDD